MNSEFVIICSRIENGSLQTEYRNDQAYCNVEAS